ncbi:hypothetical protein A8709_07175 [Paenibacillus pectinilyticus]|uniref:CBM6 domain-containing protein n=1 Tax=Paenibacillus pectinilyticus TaxID=512399 RepID=A0A1C0ZTU5_9BACL|nr:CBM35 domain-containing protein [Paenibacillus pectinilyticus]OCT11443.1 hypothetical protein A8709_07175 [Paenibacillus pectinilyticus]
MKKRMLSYFLILSMVFTLVNVVALPFPAHASELDDDWTEIQGVLNNNVGIYNGVNNNIVTSGFPDGPIMGNGNVGVVTATDNNWQRAYISTTDFWDGHHNFAKPLPIGAVNIIAGNSTGSGVQQEQDMLNAEVRTTLGYGNVKMRSWVSATQNILVTDVWTTGTSNVSINVETWARNDNPTTYPVSTGVDANGIAWAARETGSGSGYDWTSRAAIATKVIGANVSTSNNGSNNATQQFTLSPNTTVRVITAIKSGKNITDHITGATATANSMTSGAIDTLHSDHLNWWKNYWLKSFVRTYDDQLEKYYYGALYEAGSSYRQGQIIGGLMGPWVTNDTPNWDGNYKLSYNNQATVAGFASSNRQELLLPYNQQVFDWQTEGLNRAAQTGSNNYINQVTGGEWGTKFNNGIPGIVVGGAQGPWGSSSEGDLHYNMVGLAVWAAQPIIWYYNATKDTNYLSSGAYNYLKHLTDFWEAYLVQENGKYVIKYSGAREFYDHTNINAAVDNAMVKNLFKNMIVYSQDLGVDSTKRTLWQDIVTNMKDLPTGTYNGKTVFFEFDGGPIRSGDWPGILMIAGHGNAVNLGSDATTRTIFNNTVDGFNSWGSGNASGFLWSSAARGGYPGGALLSQFKTLLTNNMRRNFTVPTGGHGTESMSSLDYINASMMQSQDGIIRLFPEWPNANAKFKRLRADGAFLVSAQLQNTVASNVTINSEKGQTVRILNPWAGSNMLVTENGNTVTTTKNGDIYTFNTTAGKTYALSTGGGSSSQTYEAENATLSGAAGVYTDHTGYTGTGFVANYYNNIGPTTTFTVNVPTTGTYNIALRYTAGNGTSTNTGFYVNGTKLKNITSNGTTDWNTWATQTETVTLNAGSNTIAYKAESASTQCINLDNVTISINTISSSQTYEAENATLSGAAGVYTDHTGYTGTGFVANYYNNIGPTTTFTVNVPTTGTYNIALRYSAGNGISTNTGFYVNGTKLKNITFNGTTDWNTWATQTETVTLNAGNNTIAYKAESASTQCINLDNVTISTN